MVTMALLSLSLLSFVDSLSPSRFEVIDSYPRIRIQTIVNRTPLIFCVILFQNRQYTYTHTDITNRESFRKAKFWVDELLQNEERCAIYLVGTKRNFSFSSPSLTD
jgi:hypothetical protein